MSSIKKQILKCKHPNSRKTLALSKQLSKTSHRNKQKMGQYMKQNLIGEKIAWFRDNLEPEVTVCTPIMLENLIEKYLTRFDEELEQIQLKHSIGNRKNRQHASREDIININKKREAEEFSTCGLEVPDFLNNQNLQVVQKWTGELRFLQNIKLKRYSRKHLQQLQKQITEVKVKANHVALKENITQDSIEVIDDNKAMDVDVK